eukprot:3030288-Rhodomonas_salina.4
MARADDSQVHPSQHCRRGCTHSTPPHARPVPLLPPSSRPDPATHRALPESVDEGGAQAMNALGPGLPALLQQDRRGHEDQGVRVHRTLVLDAACESICPAGRQSAAASTGVAAMRGVQQGQGRRGAKDKGCSSAHKPQQRRSSARLATHAEKACGHTLVCSARPWPQRNGHSLLVVGGLELLEGVGDRGDRNGSDQDVARELHGLQKILLPVDPPLPFLITTDRIPVVGSATPKDTARWIQRPVSSATAGRPFCHSVCPFAVGMTMEESIFDGNSSKETISRGGATVLSSWIRRGYSCQPTSGNLDSMTEGGMVSYSSFTHSVIVSSLLAVTLAWKFCAQLSGADQAQKGSMASSSTSQSVTLMSIRGKYSR